MAKENTNVSSKYKDIKLKSDRIHSGSPAVYQLRPKKGNIGTQTRMTVGEKNTNKINKTILLVGETGAGKSNIVNTLFNYALGVKWEDNVWFQIVEDENRSQAESQTSEVIVYEIFGFEDETLPYSLTIIDTPGYGDTRGLRLDDNNTESLRDLFQSEDGVHEVHAVGLVIKADENRVSDRLIYIVDSMMSLFGNDLEKNIVILVTHSDGRIPPKALQTLENAKIKCAKNEKNEPVYFLFNNSQGEDRTENEEVLQSHNKTTVTGIKQFTAFLEKAAPKKLVRTTDVLNERIRLTACIQNLQERIEVTELKQTEIRQIQEALKKNDKVEADEVYKEKNPVRGGMWGLFFYKGAMCCTVCEENCHYPGCTIAWYPEHCKVMKDGCCTVCKGKCPSADHVKEKWRYVTKTRKVKNNLQDLKKKYDTESESTLLENLEKEMEHLTAEKSKLLDESYQHVVRLEQIALKSDCLSTVVHFDFLIERMKEKRDTEKAKKLEEMKDRVDERTKAALRYKKSLK